MIGQYLPQTNESATVPKTQNFCQLNKAEEPRGILQKTRLLSLSFFWQCDELAQKKNRLARWIVFL
jgi:hypothetical protein